MKTIKFILLLSLFFLIFNTFSQTEKFSGGLSDKVIAIPEGCNFSFCTPTPTNPNTIVNMKPLIRTFKFSMEFHGSSLYDPPETAWQKVMRISKLFTLDNSLRFGWRRSDDTYSIEVGIYGHIGENFAAVSLNKFAPIWEKIENYELMLTHHGFYAKAGQNAYAIKRKLYEPDEYYTTGMARNAFFEDASDDPAPHNMHISVSDIYYDYASLWTGANNKGFYYSVFYEDDDYTYVANNDITAPTNQVSGGIAEPTVIVENGAHIDFIAGNEIHLTHGFHAEAGSYFHAKVLSKKINTDTILNLFDPTVPDSLISYKPVPDSILSLYEKEESQYYNTLLPTKEEEETLIFSIYPNPTKGNLTIQVPSQISDDYSIQIFNSIGYSIFQKEKVSLSKLSIDISTQPKGIYFVRIIAEEMVFQQKVIIK